MQPTLSASSFPRRQRGAVLFVSLMLLLVMTILAISASQSTRMQERMASNTRDSDVAFQAAEAGLRGVETYLTNLSSQPSGCSTAPCTVYQKNVLPADLAHQSFSSWWLATSPANATEYGTAGTTDLTGVSTDPRYTIEEYAVVFDDLTQGHGQPTYRVFYRNTSSAVGRTQSAQSVVQGTYTRRF